MVVVVVVVVGAAGAEKIQMHSTMLARTLPAVPYIMPLPLTNRNCGPRMNELSTKILMEVEVKPFFSPFNGDGYGALIGYAW